MNKSCIRLKLKLHSLLKDIRKTKVKRDNNINMSVLPKL